ncbi:MAG: hypothetical protein IJF70_08510 [Opitutales bacterium]|nr:hypothetical protein [Opitutales bacterium]
MLKKLINPNAKFANIALALFYIAVISALFFGALSYKESCAKTENQQNIQKTNS